jgi:hypothetical protein
MTTTAQQILDALLTPLERIQAHPLVDHAHYTQAGLDFITVRLKPGYAVPMPPSVTSPTPREWHWFQGTRIDEALRLAGPCTCAEEQCIAARERIANGNG